MDPESTGALISQVLDYLSSLTSGMKSLAKIIGLKLTCFSFLENVDCLSFLVVIFIKVFNR